METGGIGGRRYESPLIGRPGYDGNAYTMTSTYYPDVVMTLYTLHALEGNRDKVIWTNFA